MTVQTETNVAIFEGNGVADEFDYAFRVLDSTHLLVEQLSATTGLVTKTYTAGEYTVSGVGTNAGSVTLLAGALSASYHLRVTRVVPYTQELDIVNQGGFYPETVEEQLDLTVMGLQQVGEIADRALVVPPGETGFTLSQASDRAGKFLAFDAGGDLTETAGMGSDGALRVDLAASGGSALVGFIQAGSGAVARTAQARLRETISVMDYGAVGDGVTNDAAAIQAAVDHAETIGEGALVHFPAGKYLVNTTITVRKSGVRLEGDGAPATWVVNGTTNGAAIQFGDGVSTYFRNGIRGMIVGQQSGVAPVAGNCGVKFTKCGNVFVENFQVFQFPAALYDGLVFNNVTQSYITNIGLQSCLEAAWRMENNTFGIFAANGRCDTSKYGMWFRDCQGIYMTNFDNYGNTKNAFNIGNAGLGDTRFFFFTNCIGDTSGEHNWSITALQVGRFANCWGATQLVPETGFAGDGFYVSGILCEDIAFSNCVAVSNNRHGINLDYVVKASVDGCTLGSNFAPAFAGGKGPGNGVGTGGGSGLVIGSASSRVSVNGGIYTNNQRYGAEVASGAQRINIAGVEMRDNVLGRILNNANASAGECKISNVGGYNPVGFITAPAIPASGNTATNLSGVDVMVYLAGGTLTGNVEINGHGVLAVTNTGYYLPAGATIKLTYSVAPAWQWHGF